MLLIDMTLFFLFCNHVAIELAIYSSMGMLRRILLLTIRHIRKQYYLHFYINVLNVDLIYLFIVKKLKNENNWPFCY